MNKEYYEDMLEQIAINKYLNMIANDYNGQLAKIFEEKYINKDKEIERLNNILDTLMQDMAVANAIGKQELKPKYVFDRIAMLRGDEQSEN